MRDKRSLRFFLAKINPDINARVRLLTLFPAVCRISYEKKVAL